MNNKKRITALLLLFIFIFSTLTSCIRQGGGDVTTEPSSSVSDSGGNTTPETDPGENVTSPSEGDKVYNIIYALATIPPVLAALDSISSGNETYAIIERGKTYNGIESLEYFHNAGFDITSNKSTGFTEAEFVSMINTVKDLNENNENAFFYFYAQDGTALSCAAVAANAGLEAEDFHIMMCEDGTGAYVALYDSYINGFNVVGDKDEIYENYIAKVKDAENDFSYLMGKTDTSILDKSLKYNIAKAFALASLPNFTYYLQDRMIVENILKSSESEKILTCFGIEGKDLETECRLNLKYQKISEAISKLNETQKADYLTLMYGSYYEDTYSALTRTERAGEPAPGKKLVFIGSRHREYPDFASDAQFGIGGLEENEKVPMSYAELDSKYKMPFLFPNEQDYNIFLSALNNSANYSADVTTEARDKAQTACFNLYIDYIFTIKFAYIKYGAEYDIIMKGHPREAVGSSDEWGNRYGVTYGDNKTYVFDKLLDGALLAFHESDSIGKYIGMVPYGTAAENLAYLGVEISIAGLPSSTYSGFDTDVDVLFIMAASSQTIADTDSQVKERYEAGNLTYIDSDGNKLKTVYYNTGNVYKAVAAYLRSFGDTKGASAYQTRFDTWLSQNHSSAKDIDASGFPMYLPATEHPSEK